MSAPELDSGNIAKIANDLLSHGFSQIEKGKKDESFNNFDSAAFCYFEGCSAFAQALNFIGDERTKVLLQGKINEFSTLARNLKARAATVPIAPKIEAKNPFEDADFLMEAALKADEAKKYDQALDLYLQAAQKFIEVGRAPKATEEQKKLGGNRAVTLMDRSEEIKRMLNGESISTEMQRSSVSKCAPAGEALTDSEREALKKSSFINSLIFLPWVGEDLKEKFYYMGKFEDPDGLLRLAPKQSRRFNDWKRPDDMHIEKLSVVKMMNPHSITQTCVGDCSFVASLCISAAYEVRFKKKLISSIIYPQNRAGEPIYNPSGKYMVRLHFNGIARKIIVDDRLPVDHRGNLLCAYSGNGRELWVSIIEKAYMKLHGGYDFPGSNSGVDLYCLTGWLPEPVSFSDEKFKKERTWQRLISGARYGDCLMTIATPTLTTHEEESKGLVSGHAYAVLDAKEACGVKLLRVKNPWARQSWNGKYSANDSVNWTSALKRALQYDQMREMEKDNGIFWIDFDSVITNFAELFFNWNTDLLKCKTVIHGQWGTTDPGPKNDSACLGYNPQFSLVIDVPEGTTVCPVWLLLSRHTNKPGSDKEDAPFITTHVFRKPADSNRIWYPDDAINRGVYRNGLHSVERLDLSPGKHEFTIVISQHEDRVDLNYSLQVNSSCAFSLKSLRNAPKMAEMAYQWTTNTAGGSSSHATFMNNPQWRVTIPRPCRLFMQLNSTEKHAINLRLVKSDARISSCGDSSTIMNSGNYRKSFCYFDGRIGSGNYVLVPSTFKPNCIGRFNIKVLSTDVHDQPRLALLKAEGEGMFKKSFQHKWSFSDGTAAGCANHKLLHKNPQYLLDIPVTCKIQIRLRSPGTRPLPSLLASIYSSKSGTLLDREIMFEKAQTELLIAETGKGSYTNPPSGVATELIEVPAGQYIVVPSTYSPLEANFELIVYSSKPIVSDRIQ
eukprot:TRINITY_DN3858_c0_g1_i1.p1 TRINITY_DN3858_c0_g1~~TRINITY_DN3858_c0_g1_i1.p1  ORF type:complete len:951 (+),score=238.09 TRINITY_DN3858_c0_g1_i1:136-2988(+)